jgi:putative transposase
LVDGRGVPLSIVVSGANLHDSKAVGPVLEDIIVVRPDPAETAQNFCGDKAFDYPGTRRLVASFGYIDHIKARGDEARELATIPGARARRWVVEASHSWFNRFRRILVRWEKKGENYHALLMLAAGVVAFRHAWPDRSRRDGMILG